MSEPLAAFCWDWTAFMAGQLSVVAVGGLLLRWREWRRNARSVARAGDPSWLYRQTSATRTKIATED